MRLVIASVISMLLELEWLRLPFFINHSRPLFFLQGPLFLVLVIPLLINKAIDFLSMEFLKVDIHRQNRRLLMLNWHSSHMSMVHLNFT
jgi:hypothetical protein